VIAARKPSTVALRGIGEHVFFFFEGRPGGFSRRWRIPLGKWLAGWICLFTEFDGLQEAEAAHLGRRGGWDSIAERDLRSVSPAGVTRSKSFVGFEVIEDGVCLRAVGNGMGLIGEAVHEGGCGPFSNASTMRGSGEGLRRGEA